MINVKFVTDIKMGWLSNTPPSNLNLMFASNGLVNWDIKRKKRSEVVKEL